MQHIQLDQITLDETRQRTEFDQRGIEALADSMARLGQFHAIVLDPETPEKPYNLRAGERRLRAARLLASRGIAFSHAGVILPVGSIAYTRTSDLTADQLYEVELEENIQRVDLSWQDRVVAMSKLKELQDLRAGREVTMTEFAREVTGLEKPDSFRERATDTLLVAKHLDKPEVAKAKSIKEAVNIIKRQNDSILREELSKKLAAHGLVSASQHVFHEGSAFDWLPGFASNSFDLIITDPPYGIDMHTMSTQSGSESGHTHAYLDTQDYADECIKLVAHEGYRVTKASAACYMFCDIRLWPRWSTIFKDAGWYVWPVPLIWDKSPTGMILGLANGPRHVYETILYAIKGNRPVNSVGPDVIRVPGPAANKRHPAEKPVDLYSELLMRSAVPGDSILDPFCGCGPIFPAASRFQCRAFGSELDPQHAAHARLRATSPDELL